MRDDYLSEIKKLNSIFADDSLYILYKKLRDYALGFGAKQCLYYLDMVRKESCLFHPHNYAEPHHIFGSVHGMKSADIFCVPLCRKCHEYAEAHPRVNSGLIEFWIKLVSEKLSEKLRQEEYEDFKIHHNSF